MAQEGWGLEEWGTSQWGFGADLPFAPDPVPPVITAVDPRQEQTGLPQTKPICISLSDDTGISLGTLQISVSGLNWVFGGVAVNGAVMNLEANGQNGYDLELFPPTAYPNGSRQEVSVHVRDIGGAASDLVYYFTVGVGPRLLTVRNPQPNLLLAHFNRPMRLDDTFFFVGNWRVTPVSPGAAPLTITEVTTTTSQPDVAHIRYSGGGSEYQLTVLPSILSQDGDALEQGFNTVLFEILFGDEDEATIRLFDSVFGPLGISQRVATRRSMDEHTADRSLALALDEQFRLRFQQLDNTVGRDGRPGKLRT